MRRPAAVANSMRFSSASPPFQFAAVSGQPAGEPGAYGRWPACVRNAVMGRRSSGTKSSERYAEITKSCGVLNFASGSRQLSLGLDQRAIDVRELAVAPQIDVG